MQEWYGSVHQAKTKTLVQSKPKLFPFLANCIENMTVWAPSCEEQALLPAWLVANLLLCLAKTLVKFNLFLILLLVIKYVYRPI